MKKNNFIQSALLVTLMLWCLSGCNDKNESPGPDQGTNEGVVFNPKVTTDMFGETYRMEFNDEGKIEVYTNVTTGSYRAYRYLPDRIIRSFHTAANQTAIEEDTYLLDQEGRLKELSFLGLSGATARRFNYQYDNEGHVIRHETDSKNSSGQVTYHYRYEWEWKNGNLVRSRQLDLLKNNAVVNDRTYEYDLSKNNTLFPQALAVRPTMGILDPNFNMNMLAGKGPKNVVLKDISTADPTKFGVYTYTYDNEGRTISVVYFGDKMTVGY